MNESPHHLTLDAPARSQRRRWRRRTWQRPLLVGIALVGLALASAACSSDPSTPGVAGAGTGDTATTSGSSSNQGAPSLTAAQKAQELAYSECMRSHGVPDFPDPNSNGQIQISGGPNSSTGFDPNSPAFQTANKACQSKQPQPTKAQQAQALAAAIKQSQCMRNHGIKDYPDPSSSGGRVTMQIQASSGSDLNPNDPLFQKAAQACMPNSPLAKAPPTSGNGSFSQGQVFGS
jgi:hypothetical protein